MNPEHWLEIQNVYHQALALDAAAREVFLAQVCANRSELRDEVESLLSASERSNDFLQHSVFQVGLELLAEDDDDDETVESRQKRDALADLIGQTLAGRYLVERKLASGGMGEVYLARDKPELMSRQVVVKVLQEKALQNEWILTKFKQEIEALTRIDDPGVVGILDAGSMPNGNPFLVMQFVDGDNLRAHTRPEQGMELRDVANIMQQVGRTLAAAHECDIVHRDLKPENIMVRRRATGTWQVKVIDFGIAKVRHSLIAPSTVTGRAAGTANYMSPEQLQGKRITAASDIYALGVIAYELVTGRRPFNPETAFQLVDLQKAGVAIPPRSLRPSLSVTAQTVILGALSYQPPDRYQDAGAFGDDLAKALLAHEDVLSTLDDVAEQVSTAVPDNGEAANPKRSLAGTRRPPTGGASSVFRFKWLILAAVLLVLVVFGVFGWRYLHAPKNVTTPSAPVALGPERVLTYWLTIQREINNKPVGKPFEATGKNYFQTGDGFALTVASSEPGALYLISEGVNSEGAVVWSLLFPLDKKSTAPAQLNAGQQITTGSYHFLGTAGVEKIWVVWATKPVEQLDRLVREVLGDPTAQGFIKGVDDVRDLQDFLLRNESNPTTLEQDEVRSRAAIRGRGEILVRRLELLHKPN